MDTQPKIQFIINNNQIIELPMFSDIEKIYKLNDPHITEIKENIELCLKFSSNNPTSKLYFPELEDYHINSLLEDEDGNFYFKPSDDKVKIISYDKNDSQKIPLIPGYYPLVVESDDSILYTIFKVISTNLSTEEWENMRDEIEDFVRGLSINVVKQNEDHPIVNSKNKYIDPNIFQKIDTLTSNTSKMIINIESIIDDPKFLIKKEYSWKLEGTKALIDSKTIKKTGQFPERKGMLYSPTRKLSFDVQANRELKKFLIYFKEFCENSRQTLSLFLEKEAEIFDTQKRYNQNESRESKYFYRQFDKKKAYFEKSILKLRNVEGQLIRVLNMDWMNHVKVSNLYYISKSTILDARYNFFYRLYNNLNKNSSELKLNSNYQFYWKQTHVLYEIWCFIKLIKILEELGFIATSGWIYDMRKNTSYIIPYLDEGTRISFIKDNLVVHLVYNQILGRNSNQLSLDNPLTTISRNNKPDIRLDLLEHGDRYLGSIIFDAKYRALQNILKDSNLENSAISQLRNYRYQTRTKLLSIPEPFKDHIRSVSSVWALFPTLKRNEVPKPSYKLDDRIFFQLLKPGEDETEFKSSLEKEIKDISLRIELLNRTIE